MSGLIPWGLFLGLAGLAAITAAGMLVTMSMYRAGLALMASFVALAGLFLLLNADLLAAIQVMMNVGGMLIMILFMVMLMIDPGGEMMWDMKRKMSLPGPGAFSMSMPRAEPVTAQADSAPSAPARGDPPPVAPATIWTCPMHPAIHEGQPGQCPICGMDLVPAAPPVAPAGPPAGEPASYTCPMHPEVREGQPGQCPICGMDLLPAASGAPADGSPASHTCPMHPAIHEGQPGQCPICGMDLVPATTPAAPTDPSAGEPASYTCPMHPEVHEGQPGQCPICGMDLVPGDPPAAPGDPPAGEPASYTCPMHPEIREGQPGQCPICGMDLLPAAPAGLPPVAPVTIWTCPMHPAIHEGQPGQCPICSMDLVPAATPAASADPPAGEPPSYTCPMHPVIHEGQPGQCPICGMDLLPAAPAGGDVLTPGTTQPVSASSSPLGKKAPHPGADMRSSESHTANLSPAQYYQMMAGMAMSTTQLPWALAIGAACTVALGLLILRTPWSTSPDVPTADATSAVGQLLLSRYMIGFEGAAFLIVAGIIGAVVFASRERQTHPGLAPLAAPRLAGTTAAALPEGVSSGYTCPMHPEIREAQPGQCPLCGMDLVPAGSQAPAEAARMGHQPHGGPA